MGTIGRSCEQYREMEELLDVHVSSIGRTIGRSYMSTWGKWENYRPFIFRPMYSLGKMGTIGRSCE